MNITVIVPTYRRPQDLQRCLQALETQTYPPTELLITVRDTDTETWNFLSESPPQNPNLKIITVTVPGVVAAMNQALASATGEIICFTDDDAAPHADWLEKIQSHFQNNPQVGAVGGRDLVYHGEQLEDGEKTTVGKLLWFGKVIGNHHLGIGDAREVDIIKGVNMSYRRQAIEKLNFDTDLRGTGAQVHFEIGFCLKIKQRGWKIIYDPTILVNHYVAQRFDEDQRNSFNSVAFSNTVYNETLMLVDNLSWWRRSAYLIWSVLIGTSKSFGLLQYIRFFPREKKIATQKLQLSLQARWEAWQTWQNK